MPPGQTSVWIGRGEVGTSSIRKTHIEQDGEEYWHLIGIFHSENLFSKSGHLLES